MARLTNHSTGPARKSVWAGEFKRYDATDGSQVRTHPCACSSAAGWVATQLRDSLRGKPREKLTDQLDTQPTCQSLNIIFPASQQARSSSGSLGSEQEITANFNMHACRSPLHTGCGHGALRFESLNRPHSGRCMHPLPY